jgi:hypothetical protein
MAESCCDRVSLDWSPGAWRDRAEGDRAERDSVNPRGLVADRLKETTDLPIPALVQIDEEMRLSS